MHPRATECLNRVVGLLRRTSCLLALVGHGSVGLGEVLQDYAAQGARQIDALLQTLECKQNEETDPQILESIPFTLNAAKSVLQMLPSAMQRNKSDVIGEKDRWSRTDIAALREAFTGNPDIIMLLELGMSESVFAPAADATSPASAASGNG